MSATPPEANPEYSRARRQSKAPKPISLGVLAGSLIGACLVLVAEVTPLYSLHSAAATIPLRMVHTGSHHGYALVPVALLASALAVAASRSASRPALLAVGALGILTILVALIGDLPDATATGYVAGFTRAKSVPQIGLYLETLGASLLLVTSVAGLLLTSPPRARAAV